MSQITPLSVISEYNELVTIYEKNKNKPWQDWLEFDQTFDKPGKQGLVGILRIKDENTDKKKVIKFVFKISQYINYLSHHELIVMKGLNDMSPYCLHFCKTVGSIMCQVDPKARKDGNPFEIKTKYPIEKEALLTEYIDKSSKMYNYIRTKKIDEDIIYSTIKQTMMALIMAQKKKKFTHYDLHSNNIMMKKCNKDMVFLYVLDDGNQFCIPTLGYYPIIIDYGFSYISDMDDGPLWASMGHTDVGFMSDRFDWVADPKLFLVTVSGEMKEKRGSRKAKRLRRVVRNLFGALDIDWESGWDDEDDQAASDYVMEMLEDYNESSKLFEDYDHHCIDLIQSLIILPLEEQDYSNIHTIYKLFLREWTKIENEITSPFYNLYILKGVVDAARHVRAAYHTKSTRTTASLDFTRMVTERINKVVKFCKPKNLSYERLLCTILMLAKCIEGVLYDVMFSRVKEKEKNYSKLPLQSTEHIYAAIEANIPDTYKFNKKTKVLVMNVMDENHDLIDIPLEEIDIINEIHPMARGTYIYDLYKKCQVPDP